LVINKNIEDQNHLRDVLNNTNTEILCTDSVHQAIAELAISQFTLIILDAMFTEKDGGELVDALYKVTQIPVLILSMRCGEKSDNANIVSSLPSNTTVSNIKCSLLLAKHLIQDNERYQNNGEYCYTLAFGNELIIEPEKRQAYLKGKKLNLTRKEFDMLLCLASNPGKVLTREQIYSQIWETDTSFNVDDLVKTHIKTLRKKLADADIQYIKNVWGVGYRFEHETEEDGE